MSKVEYAVVDIDAAADTVVTAQECDFLGAWVTEALSAHDCDIENGNGGDVVGRFAASAAIGTAIDGHGIRMSSGINIAANAAADGLVVVAFRTTSQV